MVLSVSRRTDIPNYYSDWFLRRIKEGFCYVKNPVNPHQVSKIDISPYVVDCIVFWTKNPANLMPRLKYLKEYSYYFQFTLTGYGRDVEPNLPDKREVLIPTFQRLSEQIGKERVIWRYDPVFLNRRYTVDYHVKAFGEIADSLAEYTDKVVISFLDFYVKIQKNVNDLGIRRMHTGEMNNLASEMARIACKHNFKIETCAEKTDFEKFGIGHGSCIEQNLIEKISGCSLTGKKDKNKREACGCLESVDIGTYDTCLNGCKYCYANCTDERVKANVKLYQPDFPLLCGKITEDDKITIRNVKSLKDPQICLFEGMF